MVVVILTLRPLLRKSIHVQLSDKGMHVVVLEIYGKNVVGETVLVADHETCALLRPVDYVTVLGFLRFDGWVPRGFSMFLAGKLGLFYGCKLTFLKRNQL